MKNIVIYELHPETILVFAIPESVLSSVELFALNGVGFNYDVATDEQWAIHAKLSEATNPNALAEGVEQLNFPFLVPDGGRVYHVFFGM